MNTDFTTNAPAGAALLDTENPGWRSRIDLDRFDMTGFGQCVLGQLYGNYGEGVDELFGEHHPWELRVHLSHSHGFLDDGRIEGFNTHLQAEWEYIIREGE